MSHPSDPSVPHSAFVITVPRNTEASHVNYADPMDPNGELSALLAPTPLPVMNIDVASSSGQMSFVEGGMKSGGYQQTNEVEHRKGQVERNGVMSAEKPSDTSSADSRRDDEIMQLIQQHSGLSREQESEGLRLLRNAQNRSRMAGIRQQETEEQRQQRRDRNRKRMIAYRAAESVEQRRLRNERNRARMSAVREAETEEQRQQRNARNRLRMSAAREVESEGQRQLRNAQNRSRMRQGRRSAEPTNTVKAVVVGAVGTVTGPLGTVSAENCRTGENAECCLCLLWRYHSNHHNDHSEHANVTNPSN